VLAVLLPVQRHPVHDLPCRDQVVVYGQEGQALSICYHRLGLSQWHT
jgi:hypothetical protein